MTAAPASGQPWAGSPPSPRQIQSWQDAEVNAAAWMRYWGYVDAELTTAGADGGLDVRSTHAVAQVKYLAAAVGRPDLQRLVGAAAAAPGTQLLFFTGSDYSATAVEFANLVGIALFRYSLNGAMSPVNEVAHRVAQPTAVTAPGSASMPPPPVGATTARQGADVGPGALAVSEPDWKWRWKHGGWYLGVPIISAGVFAAVPFWHAHARLGEADLRAKAIGYSAAGVGVLALYGLTPKDDHGDPVGALGTTLQSIAVIVGLVVILASCVQLASVRRRIFSRPGWERPDPDPRLSQVLAARERRRAARKLREQDPVAARELGVGRPDLGRGYDDGGLVDLNSAAAEVIAATCGLSADRAAAIVAARSRRGSFYVLGEVFVDVPLTEAEQAELSERAVL